MDRPNHKSEYIKKAISKPRQQLKLHFTKKSNCPQSIYRYPSRTQEKANKDSTKANRNKTLLIDADSKCLAELRREAYSEFHRHIQSYNDSFVMKMRQVEAQQSARFTVVNRKQQNSFICRRPSSSATSWQRTLSSSSTVTVQRKLPSLMLNALSPNSSGLHHYCQDIIQKTPVEDKNEPVMEELTNLLRSGSIKDYSLLHEYELNQSVDLENDFCGGFGDLW